MNINHALKNIDITFVVPIYNAEQYLAQCLDGLVKQNSSKEILCIDDGSTDGSATILAQYAAQYPEIWVISKANEGVSKTRNLGIQQAKGRYIWFVDADDYLLIQDLAELIQLADDKNMDILRGVVYKHNQKEEMVYYSLSSKQVEAQYLENKKYVEHMTANHFLYGALSVGYSPKIWSGFYRTEFLRQHECYFPEAIHNAEDEYFELKVFTSSLDIVIYECSLPFYYYRNHSESASKSQINQFKGSLQAFTLMLNWCQQVENQLFATEQLNRHLHEKTQLIWAMRFITLQLIYVAYCDIYPLLSSTEQQENRELLTMTHLQYLNEWKYMIFSFEENHLYMQRASIFIQRIYEFQKRFYTS